MGADDSGGVGNLFLTCSSMDFVEAGVIAGVGMTLYNLTKNTSGVVTAVSDHTVTATGVTWDSGDLFRIVTISGAEQSSINIFLEMTSGVIAASLASVRACDCTWSNEGRTLLAQLNIISAGLFHSCPCGAPNLSDDVRNDLRQWLDSTLEMIRKTDLEVCDGETGSNYPAIGVIQQAATMFGAEQIINNDILRNLP
jgi:hypothetical protein